jgi:hypothetical protein
MKDNNLLILLLPTFLLALFSLPLVFGVADNMKVWIKYPDGTAYKSGETMVDCNPSFPNARCYQYFYDCSQQGWYTGQTKSYDDGNYLSSSQWENLWNINWDADSADCECKVGTGKWGIGFESGTSASCCGDDSNEYKKTEVGATDGTNSDYCCNSNTDCVDDNACYTSGTCHDTGSTASTQVGEYCGAGTWRDNDYSQTACDTCKGSGYWNLGGEVAATACCGDDSGEYKEIEIGATDGTSSDACCNSNTDCVDDNACYTHGTCHNTGSTASTQVGEYCYAGTWRDNDYAQIACDACVGSGYWDLGGEVHPDHCCGDDSGEYKITRVCHSACTSDSTDDACCDSSTDCVYNSNCYSSGSSTNVGGDAETDYCDSGTWYDCYHGANVQLQDTYCPSTMVCQEGTGGGNDAKCISCESVTRGSSITYSHGTLCGGCDKCWSVDLSGHDVTDACVLIEHHDVETNLEADLNVQHQKVADLVNCGNENNCIEVFDVSGYVSAGSNQIIEADQYYDGYHWDILQFMVGYYKGESGATDGSNSYYCCDQDNDCNDDGVCYNTGSCHDTGSTASTQVGEYCGAGTWRDNDYSQTACDTCKGSGYWNLGGEVAATACCGDDSGEYKISSLDGTDACCDNEDGGGTPLGGDECVIGGVCQNRLPSSEIVADGGVCGLDDDCDGVVDDNLGLEICDNNLDDDCDGATDTADVQCGGTGGSGERCSGINTCMNCVFTPEQKFVVTESDEEVVISIEVNNSGTSKMKVELWANISYAWEDIDYSFSCTDCDYVYSGDVGEIQSFECISETHQKTTCTRYLEKNDELTLTLSPKTSNTTTLTVYVPYWVPPGDYKITAELTQVSCD